MNFQDNGMKVIGAAAAVIALTGLTACSGQPTQGAGGGGEAGGTATVSIMGAPISAFAPVWIADELGYFEDNGIEVQLEPQTSGTAAIGALTSGQVDIVATPVAEIIKAEAQGFDLTYVSNLEVYGDTDATDQSGILVPAGSGILQPKDLGGKTIAVVGINTQEDAKVKATIDADGGDSSTVEFIQTTPDAMAGLLETGEVDAISPPEPVVPGLLASGTVERISGANHIPLGGTPGLGLFAAAEWESSHADVVSSMQAAVGRAIEWANDPTNADQLQAIIAEQLDADPSMPGAIAPTIYSSEATAESLEKTAGMLSGYGLLDADFDPSSLLG